MVLRDFSLSDNADTFAADICVVGAGAAGITLARELGDRGFDVILLEGGDKGISASAQELFTGESVGAPIALDEGRYRVYGGSTLRWRGRCAALDPIDFEPRPWVPDSGWPLEAHDFGQHYRQAWEYCGFRDLGPSDADVLRKRLKFNGDLDNSPIRPYIWRFAPTGREIYQDWAKRFGPRLEKSRNVTVLLNANATALVPSPSNNHVEAVEISSREGKRAQIRAREFIFACGGIENARLALNFAEQTPGLFESVSDALGRYFMQHPKAVTAKVLPEDGQEIRLQRMFNILLQPRGTQYEVGLALSEKAQRDLRLMNCSGHFRYVERPDSGWWHVKSLMGRKGARSPAHVHFKGMLTDSKRIASNAARRLCGRHSLLPSPDALFVAEVEQVPDRDSRVMLLDDRDGLGLRKARIDWRISEVEHRTVLSFTHFADVALRRLGFGRLQIDEGFSTRGTMANGQLRESYHHIGATRMSETGATGVVDGNSAVHGVDNLYFTGSSVMPTGGHANPTLTIVALALRLADHMMQRQPA
ncbi:FAD-dependent oxidoreductase [Alteraurantiacibacter aquimixticola]|uniref:GMC family oxidoreductase n=1 Tax=Alteraurantiacibacter aquimixticola TaxID=2489173 RepID=A0A4T3F1Y3_9SPHN|nr:FAD-dependent oxidoreductase [Alteraurantiacibacter aquimixticola]TIX51235.1 GMC family oxidoreductase [Alteraurantiacibacter aquimixticola]